MNQFRVEELWGQCLFRPVCPVLKILRFSWLRCIRKHVDTPPTISCVLVTDMGWYQVTHPTRHGGFESPPYWVACCQFLVLVICGDHRWIIIGEVSGIEFSGLLVELFEFIWISKLVVGLSHEARPLLIELDESMCDVFTSSFGSVNWSLG